MNAPAAFFTGPALVVAIIALLAVLIFLHELGHFLAAKALKIPVKQFALGFGPALVARQWGETQYRINALPLGGYCAFADDVHEDPEGTRTVEPHAYLRNRPLWQRTIVVSAGVVANVLIAWVALVVQMGVVGVPEEKVLETSKVGVLVTTVVGKPAKEAGLKEGDHVVAIDGVRLTAPEDFQKKVRAKPEKELTLEIVRGRGKDAEKTMTVTARPDAKGKLGVGIAQPRELNFRKATGPVEVLVEGTHQTVRLTKAMGQGLWMLFTGQLPLEMIGGPIAIVHMGATTVQNFYQFCMYAAMISLDLAIINFLPVPGLDGGHLLFILLEAIFRRPLPRRVEETILGTGLILLLGLGVLLIVKDILTLSNGG
ncbi:MAG: RIP metalloprotease RseP [Candidatus Sericytochromatia bacterium]|nr:RIP metalloprotease RseP [Candidatus Tanganyikabacteria bacterium]